MTELITSHETSKNPRKAKQRIFRAVCGFGNYEVTALGFTEDEAKQAVMDSLRKPVQELIDAGHHDSVEAFWDYIGGSVTEMTVGEAEWL